MNHVPYRDGGINDVMNGTVDVSFDASTSTPPHIRGGKLRALATSGAKRLDALPDVPTVGETLPGFLADSWQGVLVPRGTPADVIGKLATESQKIIECEDFRVRLRESGLPPASGVPGDFAKVIADDSGVGQGRARQRDQGRVSAVRRERPRHVVGPSARPGLALREWVRGPLAQTVRAADS